MPALNTTDDPLFASKYFESVDLVYDIFQVSYKIRDHFITSLEAARNSEGIPHTTRHALSNAQSAIERIRDDSISEMETHLLGPLYGLAVTAIVSSVESILKDGFTLLLRANLASTQDVEIKVRLDELKDSGYTTDSDFWANKLIEKLLGSMNQEQKANFQNIETIERIFKDYLNVDLYEISDYAAIRKDVHQYFQIRHLLIHNNGYIDTRFIRNLDAAGIEHSYQNNQKIVIGESELDHCEEAFERLMLGLEALTWHIFSEGSP